MDAINALWTFPAIVIAAMMIAWATECGQFFISQGLALAILAWIQTLPEFAVEAVITLDAAKDPSKLHLVTANFTGSLRLFVGLGLPMVYFVGYFFRKKGAWNIKLEEEHSITLMSFVPALIYMMFVYIKGTLSIFDGVILAIIYVLYVWILSLMPPKDHEEIEDLGTIPQYVMKRKYPLNIILILAFFIIGAVMIYFSAHPFLNSMLALAVSIGISQFIFIQWVAPFLSEFPEKLSAFNWARTVTKAPMAIINLLSSSINQWTILMAMLPIVFSIGCGSVTAIPFDSHQRLEILLTIAQSCLCLLYLTDMEFKIGDATVLFLLWLVQFIFPGIRIQVLFLYTILSVFKALMLLMNRNKKTAFLIFFGLLKTRFGKTKSN